MKRKNSVTSKKKLKILAVKSPSSTSSFIECRSDDPVFEDFDDQLEGFLSFEEISDYEIFSESKNHETPKKPKDKKITRKREVSSAKAASPQKASSRDIGQSGGLKDGIIKEDLAISGVEALADTPNEFEEKESHPLEWALKYPLKKALLDTLQKLGFYKPTEIQSLVLDSIFCHQSQQQSGTTFRDIIGCAPTGSGKTLAFGLPIINHLLEHPQDDKSSEKDSSHNDDNKLKRPVSTLILVPTRELAFQIADHLLPFVKGSHVRLAVVSGGMAVQKQLRLLSKDVDILVATPGRLLSLMGEGKNGENKGLDIKRRLSSLSFLVVDEVDKMTEGKGHFKELEDIFACVSGKTNQENGRWTFVFSATLPSSSSKQISNATDDANDDGGASLRGLFGKVPFADAKPPLMFKVRNTMSESSNEILLLPENISTYKVKCSLAEKDVFLYLLLKERKGPTIVFVNSIACIRRLCPILRLLFSENNSDNRKNEPFPIALPLHSQMPQRQRLKNLDRLKNVPGCIVVATDVIGRGIDIPDVSLVIHYQIPRSPQIFIHRSGRSGRRAGTTGTSILLVDPSEHFLATNLSKTTAYKWPEHPLSYSSATRQFIVCRERLKMAAAIDNLEHSTRKVLAREKTHHTNIVL